jgi:hypothetical protein
VVGQVVITADAIAAAVAEAVLLVTLVTMRGIMRAELEQIKFHNVPAYIPNNVKLIAVQHKFEILY